MTQKEALKNIIETFDSDYYAIKFVCEWLQDINWHSECHLLWNTLPTSTQTRIDAIEEVYMVTKGGGSYSREYIEKMIEESPELQKAVCDYNDHKRVITYKGHTMTDDSLFEFGKTNFYRAFNYIYGWGLSDVGLENGWQNDRGQAFVNEILEIINPIFEEKEATAKAYRQAYYD